MPSEVPTKHTFLVTITFGRELALTKQQFIRFAIVFPKELFVWSSKYTSFSLIIGKKAISRKERSLEIHFVVKGKQEKPQTEFPETQRSYNDDDDFYSLLPQASMTVQK